MNANANAVPARTRKSRKTTARKTTARKTTKVPAKKASAVTVADKVRQGIEQAQANFVARDTECRMIALACLAGCHVYMVGVPGTAKSAVSRALAPTFGCYDGGGAKFFGVQTNPETTLPKLFGPMDVPAFRGKLTWSERFAQRLAVRAAVNQGHVDQSEADVLCAELDEAYEEGSRQISKWENYLPGAHFAHIDEPDKASKQVFDGTLEITNEGTFDQDGRKVRARLKTAVMSGNAIPDPARGVAFYDRLQVRLHVTGDMSDGEFFDIAEGNVSASPAEPGLTLAEWEQACEEVRRVKVDGVRDIMREIRAAVADTTNGTGYEASVRRWRGIYNLVRASAWLDGRDEAAKSDCLVAAHCLWDVPEQAKRTFEIVRQFAPVDFRTEAKQLADDFRTHWRGCLQLRADGQLTPKAEESMLEDGSKVQQQVLALDPNDDFVDQQAGRVDSLIRAWNRALAKGGNGFKDLLGQAQAQEAKAGS